MTAPTIADFVAAQRAKRAASGLAAEITAEMPYRLIEGLLAGRRSSGGDAA